jgi:hypothetical protein
MGIALLLSGAAILLVRKQRKSARIGVTVLLLLAGSAAYIGGYLAWWYAGRAEPLDREIFHGVRHLRVVLKDPRDIVVNLIFVNLKDRGLRLEVTPADPHIRPKLEAATVGQFLERTGVQVAMNANFFHPFHSKSPWDYYPKRGDPIEVLGIAASTGDMYSTQVWAGATLYLAQSNQVQFGGTVDEAWNAVAGDQWLIRDGHEVAAPDSFGVYPRAAAAANTAGDTLILAVVDGKQPGFSEGMTLPEFAQLLKTHAAENAINLDGGGSVTMVMAGQKRRPIILNSPIHTRIPGRQRPVGNHIGVRMER